MNPSEKSAKMSDIKAISILLWRLAVLYSRKSFWL